MVIWSRIKKCKKRIDLEASPAEPTMTAGSQHDLRSKLRSDLRSYWQEPTLWATTRSAGPTQDLRDRRSRVGPLWAAGHVGSKFLDVFEGMIIEYCHGRYFQHEDSAQQEHHVLIQKENRHLILLQQQKAFVVLLENLQQKENSLSLKMFSFSLKSLVQ